MDNKETWIIIITAFLSAIGGWVATESIKGTVEGLSIIIVAALMLLFQTLADWLKDRRFINMQALIKEDTVPVIRGKFGVTQTVSVWDVVVGDIVLLSTGAKIPADCVVIESSDLAVDESKKDELEDPHPKAALEEQGDPFLKAGTIIVRGSAKAVVCSVGVNSTRGIGDEKFHTDLDTPLQSKLKNLSAQFSNFALYGTIIIFVMLIVTMILKMTGN